MTASRPVLIVTNAVPPDRVGAFAALHARRPIELALYGGRSTHATAGVTDPGVPSRHVSQRDVYALAASGRYAAVVAGTTGRIALPAAWRGARRGGSPFVLWTALWAHPRTPAHLPGAVLLRAIYRDADAVATYGRHVSDFVTDRGAQRVFIAPQAVDGPRWERTETHERFAPFTVTFIGRDSEGKGLHVLDEAWHRSDLRDDPDAALVLIGVEPHAPLRDANTGVHALGIQPPTRVRGILAGSDVVVVPSVRTRRFREPWSLVVNEALHAGCAVVASTEVGAVAGGLIVNDRTGVVIPAGNATALASALADLRANPERRRRLANAGADAVRAFTYTAWADGMACAIDAASTR